MSLPKYPPSGKILFEMKKYIKLHALIVGLNEFKFKLLGHYLSFFGGRK